MVSGLGARFTKFNLADVRVEADHMLQLARDEAERIKAQARDELHQAGEQAEVLRRNAHKEGFQQGYTEGLESGKKQGSEQAYAQTFEEAKKEFADQNRGVLDSLSALFTTFETERDHIIAQAQQELLALALTVAARVTHHQLTIDDQIVLENIKAAVSLVSSRSSVIVKINPTDLKRFELMDAEKAQKLLNVRHVEVIGDETVDIGGCVVQTENGSIDAQVSNQLETIIRQLAPAMEETVRRWSAKPVIAEENQQS
jgi:flagellar assembly protein FliH